MKKFIYILICFFTVILNVEAGEKKIVTLNKCVDGDTAWFNLDDEKIKARFLAIDTPESTKNMEKYGKEASEYTCTKLKEANTIEIEYDNNSDKTDKYDRHLVWIFTDGKLLQKDIVSNGLAEVKYVYGDYKYLDNLNNAQKEAKDKKLNIWSDYQEDNSELLYYVIVGIAIIIIIIVFKPKKSTVKKIVKQYLK